MRVRDRRRAVATVVVAAVVFDATAAAAAAFYRLSSSSPIGILVVGGKELKGKMQFEYLKLESFEERIGD